MMTVSVRRHSFAKRMEGHRKRLMHTEDEGEGVGGQPSPQEPIVLQIQCPSLSFSARLHPQGEDENSNDSNDRVLPNQNDLRWQTTPDHTSPNNRMPIPMPRAKIRRRPGPGHPTSGWIWIVTALLFYLILGNCLGSPEPVRVSKVRNEEGARVTTSRSTTSFLMSDAITTVKRSSTTTPSSLPRSPLMKVNSSRPISPNPYGSHYNSSLVNYNKGSGSSSRNANLKELPPTAASRRLAKSSSSRSRSKASSNRSSRHRKSKLETTTMSSIDRPFYTKITMSDAVSKPPTWGMGGGSERVTTKKPKRNKYSSSSASTSSSEKYSRTKSKGKASKSKHNSSNKQKQGRLEPQYDWDELDLGEKEALEFLPMPHTTEKSYHPPKLSLEPFFNFLTSLATASREVIMSKEQYNGHQPTPGTTEQPVEETGSKYSEEEEEEDEQINLDPVEEPPVQQKKRSKKKGGRGSRERQKVEISEEIVKEEEPPAEYDQGGEGPIPFPLPNNFVGSDQIEDGEGEVVSPVESNPGGLHILDVLRTPMVADYGSTTTSSTTTTTQAPPLAPPRPNAQPFRASPLESIVKGNEIVMGGRPPSGRSNILKSQVNQGFMPSGGSGVGGERKEKTPRSEPAVVAAADHMSQFHDQSTDLQAQASYTHSEMVPPPNTFSSSDGHQMQDDQEQEQQVNDPASSQQVSGGTDIFGQPASPQNDDAAPKYPSSFVYHQPLGGGNMPPGSRLYMTPPRPSPFGPGPPPFRMSKLRPNLHSYYDPNYHSVAGAAEQPPPGQPMASEMIGLRMPYGPPHFTPPPHHRILPSPHPPPPRIMGGYGGAHHHHHPRPGPSFMNMLMPHRGTHYMGSSIASSHEANEPSQTGPDADLTSNNNNNGGSGADLSGSDVTGSDDQPDLYREDNSLQAAEHSENKKVGIMESFDLFYKEYKIMTWVTVFFVTSLALLTLLAYLYVNNPPTEVVQARALDLLNSPQISKFLSSMSVILPRSDKPPEPYLKPLGKGFGAKSGRQRRKQTRSGQDKMKQKIKRKILLTSASRTRPILMKRPTTAKSRNGNSTVLAPSPKLRRPVLPLQSSSSSSSANSRTKLKSNTKAKPKVN